MFVLRFTSALVLISTVFSAKLDCSPCECNSEDCNIIEADCSADTIEIQIQVIPTFLSSRVEHLNLNKQQLKELEENVFENANLTELKKLSLQRCQISEIHKNAFANMSKLTSLDVSANNLSHIDNGTFSSMINLNTLDLRHNSIQNLLFLQNLTQLETLLLDNNSISYLDENLFSDNTKLESLHLSNNKIEILPDKIFNNLNNLRNLHLSFNKISRIPNNLFQNCSKLCNLYLENNTIVELPENMFVNITGLNFLDLENNKIRKIPENIFRNLFNLSYILLKNNELESIPNNTFKNLSKLQELDLSENKINTLNPGFLESSSCSNGVPYGLIVFLSQNNLSSLPPGVFRKACSRIHIDLSYNKISTVDSNTFSDASIISVSLAHNKISFLSSNTFKNIKVLDLSFNNLSLLPAGIFVSSNFLLNLNNNNIETLFSQSFGNDTHGTILLANNKIKYFEMNKNFFHLDLSNNPINCDCKLKKQHELFTHKLVNIQCSTPLSLQGKSWGILNSDQFACQPKIRNNFTETKNGNTRQISCKVYASPAPDIRWIKYNKTIQDNGNTILQTRTNDANDVYWYNLTFTRDAIDFAGQYSCILNNSAGVADMSFTVLQQVQLQPNGGSTHTGKAIGITVLVVLLIVLLVVLVKVYRKRQQRRVQGTISESNLLYNPLDN